MKELHTYRDLRMALLTMPIDHPMMDQPIQCILPIPDDSRLQLLLPTLAIGTLRDLGFEHTRSSYSKDGMHEPDDWVFLLDVNPFGEDGVVVRDLETMEPVISA